MLLQSLTNQLQSDYAAVQVQIEELQEQQRLIQAQLQRIGSVESKMESAAALVMEAIADIKEVCPKELAGYKTTILSLFTDAPSPALPAVKPEPTEPAPEPTPEPTEPTEPTGDTVDVTATTEPEAKADEAIATIEELNELAVAAIRKLAGIKKVATTGRRYEIAQRLQGLVTKDELFEADQPTYAQSVKQRCAKFFGVEIKSKADIKAMFVNRDLVSFMEAVNLERTGKDFYTTVESYLDKLQAS